MAWLPLQHGSIHPSKHLSPGSTCPAPGPAADAPRQGPWNPRARPEAGRGGPRQAQSRVEPAGVHCHVPAWIPPQNFAWARTFSGRHQSRHSLQYRARLCVTGFTCRMFFSLWLHFSLHQVLSYIAKGSFGPILKVKDKAKQRTYAVKVSQFIYSWIW